MAPTSLGRACSPSESSPVCDQFYDPNDSLTPCPGRGLALPPGAQLPEAIQRALESAPRNSIGNRESLQRKRFWWLPYVVLEFDKNEILIDALGGDLSNPVWNYRAHLYVLIYLYFYSPEVTKERKCTSDVSRTSNIIVSSYLRTASAQGQDDMGNDLLIARVELTPMLDGHVRPVDRPL